MIIQLKNSETGKIANWKLGTRGSIYSKFAYRFRALDVLKIMTKSKIKYDKGPIPPGCEYPPVVLNPKQIELALGDSRDKGEPGGIKALKKALIELQEEVKKIPSLPSD